MNITDFCPPPLLKQCMLAIHVLNADCAHQQAIFYTTDPTAVFTGVKKAGDIQTGADCAMYLPQDASFQYITTNTSGLERQARNIEQMIEQGKELGVSLLGTDGRSPISGVAMELLNNSRTSALRTINNNAGKAIEILLRTAGTWLGISPKRVSECIRFTPNNIFAKLKASPGEVASIAGSSLPWTMQEKRQYIERNGLVEEKEWKLLENELKKETPQGADHLTTPNSKGVELNERNDLQKDRSAEESR